MGGSERGVPDQEAAARAEAERLRREEQKTYYDSQLLHDLDTATAFVNKKNKRAFDERREAEERLIQHRVRLRSAKKRKQLLTESDDEYREYVRGVRDKRDAVRDAAIFLSDVESVMAEVGEAMKYVRFLDTLGVDGGVLTGVLNERMTQFQEQARRTAEDTAGAVREKERTSGEGEGPPPREKTDWEKRVDEVLSKKPMNEWAEKLGVFDPAERKENIAAGEEKKDPEFDEEMKDLINELIGVDDEFRKDKSTLPLDINNIGRWKAWQLAQRVIFKRWSVDDKTGDNVIDLINRKTPSVKELRQRGYSRHEQARELQKYRSQLESVIARMESGLPTVMGDLEATIRLKEKYEIWAFEEISRKIMQVEKDFDDSDPRLWTIETDRVKIITRVRQEILKREMYQVSEADWTRMVEFYMGGERQNLLSCIEDIDLQDEMRSEIGARQTLQKFIDGYTPIRTKSENIPGYLKSLNEGDIADMLRVLGEATDGFSHAVAIALQEYIKIGEEDAKAYYEDCTTEILSRLNGEVERLEREILEALDEDKKKLAEDKEKKERQLEHVRTVGKMGRLTLRRKKFRLNEEIKGLGIAISKAFGSDKKILEKEREIKIEQLGVLKEVYDMAQEGNRNMFSAPFGDARIKEIRKKIRVGIKDKLSGPFKDLNASGAEIAAFRLMYLFGFAGKFNFDQDPGNSLRDATADLYRPNDSWRGFMEAAISLPAPKSVTGSRMANEDQQVMRSVTLLRTWPEHMDAKFREGGDKGGHEEIVASVANENRRRAVATKKVRLGIAMSGGETVDEVVDYLRPELISKGYLAMREGFFNELDWKNEIKQIGIYNYYIGSAIDIKLALENPGTKPETATLTIEGMNWMRDRASKALSAMKFDDEVFGQVLDNVLYTWIRAAILKHDPRIKGVTGDQKWGSKKVAEVFDTVVVSNLILDSRLVEKLRKEFASVGAGLEIERRSFSFLAK